MTVKQKQKRLNHILEHLHQEATWRMIWAGLGGDYTFGADFGNKTVDIHPNPRGKNVTLTTYKRKERRWVPDETFFSNAREYDGRVLRSLYAELKRSVTPDENTGGLSAGIGRNGLIYRL